MGETTAGSSGAWELELPSLADGVHSITVKASDVSGNESTASTALSITVDTQGPSPAAKPDLKNSSDSGTSNSDNVTSDSSPTITGTTENNATVNLYREGIILIGTATASGGGSWSVTSETLPDGAHEIVARATDKSGNTGDPSPTLTLTIDSAISSPSVPDLDPASDTGASNSDGLTSDATPTFSGTAESNSSVKLYRSGNVQIGSGTADASGNWSITASSLANGSHSISAKATDKAGNSSLGSESSNITVDTTVSQPSLPDLDSADDTGSSNSDNKTSSETFVVSGTAESFSTVSLYRSGNILIGTHETGVTGSWAITATNLSDGTHSLTVKSTDRAGNTSSPSVALSVTVDSTAPSSPSTPDLKSASDTGLSSSDNMTALNNLDFSGTAEPNSTVELFTGGNSLIGSDEADGSGNWTISATALSDGSHAITAVAIDSLSNRSLSSSELYISIDTVAAAVPSTPDLESGSDTGASDIDNITSDSTPTFTGTAEPGANVYLYRSSSFQVGSGIASGAGIWSVTASTLPDGIHSITAKSDDSFGNESVSSGALVIVLDATPASAPSSLDMTSESDTGNTFAQFNDNITSITSPTITGTADPGSKIQIYDSGVLIATHYMSSTDTFWSVVLPDLAEGTYSITAKAVDSADNMSAASSPLSITVDTTSPSSPSRPDLNSADDTGSSNADNLTSKTDLSFSGTAPSNSLVKLTAYKENGEESDSAEVTTSSSGSWTMDLELSVGTFTVTAQAIDTTGNVSSDSPELTVVIYCLLYTSPSPRDLSTSRMPSSA